MLINNAIIFAQVTVPCDNPRVRKDFRVVQSEGNWDKIVTAYQTLKATGRMDYYATLHDSVFSEIHGSPSFFTWHRAFLWEVENEMRNITGDENLTLPFIDWASEGTKYQGQVGKSVAIDPYFYGKQKGKSNCVAGQVYKSFTLNPKFKLGNCIKREVDSSRLIGGWADLDNMIVTSRNYSSFNDALQYGIHGDVHMHFGGSFSTHFSPMDPLFMGHHGFVDLTLNIWQFVHNNYDNMGVNVDPDSFVINNNTFYHSKVFQMSDNCAKYQRWTEYKNADNLNATNIANTTIPKDDSTPTHTSATDVSNSESLTKRSDPSVPTETAKEISTNSTVKMPEYPMVSADDLEMNSDKLRNHYSDLKSTVSAPKECTKKIADFYIDSFVPKDVKMSTEDVKKLGLDPAKADAMATRRESLRGELAKLGDFSFKTFDELKPKDILNKLTKSPSVSPINSIFTLSLVLLTIK